MKKAIVRVSALLLITTFTFASPNSADARRGHHGHGFGGIAAALIGVAI